MMTIAEKLEMFKEKKAFIENINNVFQTKPKGSSVTSVEYEVYCRNMNEGIVSFIEYLVVNFKGGGRCVIDVSGNSNTANFRVLGTLLDGGYYEEIYKYESLYNLGYEFVKLSSDDNQLTKLLDRPMRHISDVRRCFNYCTDGNDVEKVIKMIPGCFGSFDVEFSEDGETFTIINYYEENGIDECEEAEYEFYSEV